MYMEGCIKIYAFDCSIDSSSVKFQYSKSFVWEINVNIEEKALATSVEQ